ncbi:SRPBCC family protein [Chitinophaga pendula]|uniref:SRPBCC family protein n=1 Tax=Chitinophaga TaxID=79328 RepID=UPI000BB00735|nr:MULTISPECIES: SRPBCC family protein [Chitinophaga]ASZ13646.1 polyketide cyclase [Chitinophaga sp. MD30]UCJ08728.1 SRPBCC family protein [Chitinophaga pendula]
MTQTGNQPYAGAAMLIRRPVAVVFNAFIDPAETTRFWFTQSTGKLAAGAEVVWTWEMYHVSTPVRVEEIVENERIFLEWEGSGMVEWTFEELGPDATFVNIVNTGIPADEELVAKVRDLTEGFTLVLSGLKAYLEHGIELGLVGDRFPKEMRG